MSTRIEPETIPNPPNGEVTETDAVVGGVAHAGTDTIGNDAIAPVILRLPIDAIDPSPSNPRKTFDSQELRDLAASISATGLLQPVTVRPHPATPDRYELVAGERRWRAHRVAKLAHIDAIVRDLTDAEVAIAQTVENVQRADVPPIEEGEGFARLLAAGLRPADVADRVGKSATHVRQRAALANLIPEARADAVGGRITVGAALELARVGAGAQADALRVARGDSWSGPASAAKVRDYLDRTVLLQLARAPFDRRDKSLVPEAGACVRCPKRTGADGCLFPDFARKDDRCLDAACFAAKTRAHVARAIASAVERMAPEGFAQVYAICDAWSPDGNRGALGRQDWTAIDPANRRAHRCPRSLGVYDAISGEKVGQTVVICARPDACRAHYPASDERRARQDHAAKEREKTRATSAERQLLAAAVREVAVRVAVTPLPELDATALPNALLPLIAAQLTREMQNDTKVTAAGILGLELAGETSVSVALDPAIYGAMGEGWGATRAIIHHIAARIAEHDTVGVVRTIVVLALSGEAHASPYGTDRGERIRALADVTGVDLAPLYRTVAARVAPKRAKVTPDAVTLPRCPVCGEESPSFLTIVDGACPSCHAHTARATACSVDPLDGEDAADVEDDRQA